MFNVTAATLFPRFDREYSIKFLSLNLDEERDEIKFENSTDKYFTERYNRYSSSIQRKQGELYTE